MLCLLCTYGNGEFLEEDGLDILMVLSTSSSVLLFYLEKSLANHSQISINLAF